MTLRVEISIVPGDEEAKKRKLWTFEISNHGQAAFGHYEYSVIEIDHEKGGAGLYRETILHRPSLGALLLVEKAMRMARYEAA